MEYLNDIMKIKNQYIKEIIKMVRKMDFMNHLIKKEEYR